jgi:glycosyltransferase involved in cell wall biosynthesis
MEIKGIKYIGPIYDSSGYAKACRDNIAAIHKTGIPITIQPVSFENIKTTFGEEGRFLSSLENNGIEYNIVIIHTTPEFWEELREEGKINIGYTIWETSKLHPKWPDYINNNVDKVLVGCDWNREVFRDSGVTIPIGVIPHGIEGTMFDDAEPYSIDGIDKDTFVFYSIFQWTERKHPTILIKSFFYAFQNGENVALVLKTHRGDYKESEKDAIRVSIKRIKDFMIMDNYPKLLYISDILTDNEIRGLHKRGDCYVSFDRGEGFGLSPFAAGVCGNPIIVTGYGGTTMYAKEDNSYIIDYNLTPVFGMPWSPWYRGDQLWAEPNAMSGIEHMRQVYNNREEAKEKGRLLRENIIKGFSWDVIGNKFIEELKNI